MLFQEANLSKSPFLFPIAPDSIELPPEIEHEQQQQSIISVQILLEAKQKLVKFIQSLQEHRKTELREDVLTHCAQLNKMRRVIPSHISEESIMRMVSSRIDKMMKNRKIKKNWSEEDLKILVWVISKYADLHCLVDLEKDLAQEDWDYIAQLIPGVTAHNCMFKWLSIKKTNLSVQHWAPEESNILRSIVEQELANPEIHPNSLDWKSIAQKQYKSSVCEQKVFRSAKQCRQHWNCYLNPQIKKGPWRIQEDIQLLSLIRKNGGEKKWSQIVYSFEGRTENALKNRYTLLIEKQKKFSKSKQQKALLEDCLERSFHIQASSTKQRGSAFITDIFKEEQPQEKQLSQTNQHIEIPESCQMQQSHRIESQTALESESPKVVIKFCTIEELKQMGGKLFRGVKPGCVKDGKFQQEF